MKVAFVFVAVCMVAVYAENCHQASDCQHESCTGNGWTVNCHIRQCTCNQASGSGSTNSCNTGSDCHGHQCPGAGSAFGRHCVDGHCRCTFG